MTAVIIIGAVLSAAVLWGISSYNGFVALRNKTEEAFSAMDVSLKKRYDLIPNYVETVKGYAKGSTCQKHGNDSRDTKRAYRE